MRLRDIIIIQVMGCTTMEALGSGWCTIKGGMNMFHMWRQMT